MKKGFTLVEMLIVVVIVGILMLIWLWLNRNQLAQLKAATVVEEVHTSYDVIFLQIFENVFFFFTANLDFGPSKKWERRSSHCGSA